MGRWFRRKGKDEGREEELEKASLKESETEAEEFPTPPEAEAEEIGEPEPEASKTSAAPTEPETETVTAPERGGFFRRWRREIREEIPAPEEGVFPPDLPTGIPPEPLSPLEEEMPGVFPATTETAEAISQEPLGESPPLPETVADASGELGPEASEVASAPIEAQAKAEPVPERRGFFRRWRQEAKEEVPVPEEEVPSFDLPAEIPLEPLQPLEEEMTQVFPATPEPEEEIPPALDVKVAPEIPEPADLELPGEVSEEVRRQRFKRLRERLHRTREAFSGRIDRLFKGRKVVDAELLDELEELLITADLGVETSLTLIQVLQDKLKRRELVDVERLKAALKAEMVAMLTVPAPYLDSSGTPRVVLLVGVNGVGKTTSIAKLAYRDRRLGLTPMLVAGDTFRAAAVEQLEIWGDRVGAAVVKQKTGADPAAVVFDGLAAAQARNANTVYVDTAGRLHTKVNLMEELKKIYRTAAKKIPGAPHEVLLVLDATTGQNALSQARLFHEAVGVTGLILTKMDGTAKGGVALAVVHETNIPLKFIGVGEAMEDLRPFDAEAFVEAILG